MSKRLIVILALVLVAGLSFAAYAEVQNVKVSGDITALGVARNLTLKDKKTNNDGWSRVIASIARVRIDADLTDNVAATVRLLNERFWGTEVENNGTGQTKNSDIDIDLGYVTLKEFLYSPLTLVVGRQELHFGNDMIIGDPDTNNAVSTASPFSTNRTIADLSARKAFDSVRATLNYDPIVVDLVLAKIAEGTTNLQDDTNLYGINLNYALNKTTTLEAYWWLRRARTKAAGGSGTEDRTHTIGARVATNPITELTFQLEGAVQVGKAALAATTPQGRQTNPERKAFAVQTSANYTAANNQYKPSGTISYSYFSGNRGGDDTFTAWNPMYENQTAGNIANALLSQTNAHVFGLAGSMKPVDDVTLKGEYFAFWWDKKYGQRQDWNQTIVATAWDAAANLQMNHRKFIGQEVDLTATYDYTEDVQFGLLYGIFLPGSSFCSSNKNAATEVIGSMKVTF